MRAAADVGRGHAVPDAVTRALREAHDGRSVHAASDGAADGEVLDGGAVDVAEQGSALVVGVGNVSGDGVAVAEEYALERVGLTRAHHCRDADVGSQLHELVAVVVGAIVDTLGESVPFCFAANDKGTVYRVAGSGDIEGLRAGVAARAGEHQCIAARRADFYGKILHSISVQRGRVVSAEGEGSRRGVCQRWRDRCEATIQVVCRFHTADAAGIRIDRGAADCYRLADFVGRSGVIDLCALVGGQIGGSDEVAVVDVDGAIPLPHEVQTTSVLATSCR